MAEPGVVYPNQNNFNSPSAAKRGGNRASAGGIRNIRTENFNVTNLKPTNEQFVDSYADRGLQPSYKQPTAVRNVKVAESNQVPEEEDYEYTPSVAPSSFTQRQLANRVSGKPGKTDALSSALSPAHLRATAANTLIRSFGMAWWTLQFVVAILCLVSLALSLLHIVSPVRSWANQTDPTDNILESAAKVVLNVLYSIEDAGESVFKNVVGFDLSFSSLFVATWAFLIILGLINLIGVYLTYKLFFLNPLLGEGSGIKIGTFLLALVGYSIPILNFFPWFLPWTSAVQRYPE